MNNINIFKSYNKFNYLYGFNRRRLNSVKSFKKTNYFYDPLFKYCLRLNYYNNVQKHYKLLQIDNIKNSNKKYNYFFNKTKII